MSAHPAGATMTPAWQHAVSEAEAPTDFLILRTSLQRFGREPERLTRNELVELTRIVDRFRAIETRVLETSLARKAEPLVPPRWQFERSLEDDPGSLQPLLDRGLSIAEVADAVRRQQIVEHTTELATAKVTRPTSKQAQAYYDAHPDEFEVPEERHLAHILITVQEEYAENAPEAAKARIDAIHAAARDGAPWADLARRHSECPTAVSSGDLGWRKRGQLFGSLDEAAFQLKPGEISIPVESQMGWHVLECRGVRSAHKLCFGDVEAKIKSALYEQAKEKQRQRWIRQLMKESAH